MNRWIPVVVCVCILLSAAGVDAQGFGYPSPAPINSLPQQRDLIDVHSFRLLEFRRMYVNGRTPMPHELVGFWRGANRGVVELVGYKQFIKEIRCDGAFISGDNIQVGQVNREMLQALGWQPITDPKTGLLKRRGKFAVQGPDGRGTFGHGLVFSYRDGGNRATDPAKLLVDRVVMIDSNHVLGRVTARFGLVEIPLAYFVLERM